MDDQKMSKNGNKFLSSLSAFFREIADEWLTVRDTKHIAANLKSNMLFLLSGIVFAYDHKGSNHTEMISALIMGLLVIIFASQASSLRKRVKSSNFFIKLISLLAAMGVCFSTLWLDSVFKCIDDDIYGGRIIQLFTEDFIYFYYLITPILLLSIYFVYVCMVLFWKKLISIFSENKILSDITKPEIILYTVFIIAFSLLIVFAFNTSEGLYNYSLREDIIYTVDSSWVLYYKSYQSMFVNKIKHPLFHLFASPFISPVYFISTLLQIPNIARDCAVTIIQLPIFIISNILLSKAMDLTPKIRSCFMLVSFCTYSHILFSFVTEQYIISYFWISLFIFLLCRNKRAGTFMTCAVGGTLLTGLVLVPYDVYINSGKKLHTVIMETIKQGIFFLTIMITFGRSDLIRSLRSQINMMMRFTGRDVEFSNKIFQYFAFIKNYFVSPEASPQKNYFGLISWQLVPAEHLNIAGLIILILCAVSFYINRRKRISIISAFWICFSFFITVMIGWGTPENGLILYSIYFGWAFLVLLFQLAEFICEKIKCRPLLPVLSVGTSAYLLAVNITGIMNMINFLSRNYPPKCNKMATTCRKEQSKQWIKRKHQKIKYLCFSARSPMSG